MEVPILGDDAVRWTNISILPKDPATPGPTCCPPPRNAAGLIRVPDGGGPTDCSYIIWRCHEESQSVLEVMQLSWGSDLSNSSFRFTYPEPLAPFAGIFFVKDDGFERPLHVLAVTVSGVAYLCTIKFPSSEENEFSPLLTEPFECQLFNELSRLHGATAFAVTSDFFCVGGQNGSILCFLIGKGPMAFKGSFELKGVESGLGTLWGLVSWNKNVATVRSLVAYEAHSKSYLFALHEDGSVRVWDLAQRVRLFHQNLCSSVEFAGAMASSMWLGAGQLPLQVAVLLENDTVTGKGTICVYRFHWALTDGINRPTILTVEHAFPLEKGRIVDVKLLADSIWILQETSPRNYSLFKSRLTGVGDLNECRLHEVELADQLLHGDCESSDDLFLLHAINRHPQDPLKLSITDLSHRRLFQPGYWQLSTFQRVLQSRGRHNKTEMLTLDEFQVEVNCVLSLEEGSDTSIKNLKEWRKLNTQYILSWNENNVPLSLFVDEASRSVGIIRRSFVSLLRYLNYMEQLIYGKRITENNEWDILPTQWERGSKEGSVLQSILHIMDKVASHLGQLALASFHEALLSRNRNSVNNVVASFIPLLERGYTDAMVSHKSAHFGVDNLREKYKEHHQHQRRFSLDMLLAFKDIEGEAGCWSRVLDVIENFAGYLLPCIRQPTSGLTTVPNSHTTTFVRLLATTVTQIAWNHFGAARNLLLVLELLISMQGQVNLSSDEASRIRSRIIPHVQNALIINLVLHGLGSTYGETTQTEDFSVQLSSLHIDGTVPRKGWINPVNFSLMEVLAHKFIDVPCVVWTQSASGLPSPSFLVSFANALATWLVNGDSSDFRLSFSKRVVALSSILLQHGQYKGVQNLLVTAENYSQEQTMTEPVKDLDNEWSATSHILAFCMLAQARGRPKQMSSKDNIQEAIRYFFRAASGLRETNEVLQHLFLQQGIQHLPGRGAAAAWKLHYFEWVMQVFEQYDLYEGAIQFAHAALEQVDAAAGVSATENSKTESMSPILAAIKGRLWANIFKFSLDLQLYADAYCAIISNPDEESKFTCLRRYIVVLCEHKSYQVLCGRDFPYIGMVEQVERELQWKAESSDIRAKPNFYKLLYSFHMQRHNFCHAARYMYRYFVRSREESTKIPLSQNSLPIKEQTYALAAAINSMHLVRPSSAWIDPEYAKANMHDRPSPIKRDCLGTSTFGVGGQCELPITGALMEKDYTLTLALEELAETRMRLLMPVGNLDAGDVVKLLVQAGRYETAFSLTFLFWKGTSLKRELETIFRTLTLKCFSQHRESVFFSASVFAKDSPLKLLPSDTSKQASAFEAGKMDLDLLVPDARTEKSEWLALQVNLEKYRHVHPYLPVVVAETILSFNREMELPLWLIDMFKGGRSAIATGMAGQGADPSALLRIYINHERVSEATSLFLEFLRAWASLRPVDVIKRKRMSAVWFPYTLVDRLQVLLSGLATKNGQRAHYQNLKQSLSSALQSHLNQIKIDSKDIASCMR